jgi:hypothetical protein
MMSSELPQEQRHRRVHAVLAAARRLADPRDPLGAEARRELPAATGLSAASVELSLGRHVETSVTSVDLEKLMARAGVAPRVFVVLSANVFTGVIRAVALAVAAAPSVAVRPSSREAILAPLLHRAMVERGEGTIFELCRELAARPGDHVHVYGRQETIAAVAASCPEGVTVRGHGPGFGIAVVGRGVAEGVEPLGSQAERLSWDVIAFDQRGCLSPRIALVAGSRGDAESFASALAAELEQREKQVPRGALSEEERRDQALYRQTLQAVGCFFEGTASAVGVDLEPRVLHVPPPGRYIHVARVADRDELERLLVPCRSAITCIGLPENSRHTLLLRAFAPGARCLPLGGMQAPPLDGPVDLREMV